MKHFSIRAFINSPSILDHRESDNPIISRLMRKFDIERENQTWNALLKDNSLVSLIAKRKQLEIQLSKNVLSARQQIATVDRK